MTMDCVTSNELAGIIIAMMIFILALFIITMIAITRTRT